MQAPAFRARSVPEVLDAGFQVIRAHYLQLALLSLIIASPALVLRFFLGAGGEGFVTLVQGFLTNYVIAAAVVVVSEAYLGRTVEVGEVLQRVGNRAGDIWGAAFIRGFLLLFGLLLLVVPGIIAMIMTFAMPIVVMVEGTSSSDAFERSRTLAKQNWGRIFLTLGVSVILQYMVLIGGGFALGAVFGPTLTTRMLAQVLGILFAPFPAAVGTVLYYDLRIRKEGFDIQMLMESMAGEGTQRRRRFAF